MKVLAPQCLMAKSGKYAFSVCSLGSIMRLNADQFENNLETTGKEDSVCPKVSELK